MTNDAFGWSKDRGFYGKNPMPEGLKLEPSDLELRIRKEVMELLDGIHDELETHICTDDEFKSIRIALANLDRTKDRLELLWGKE